MILYLVKVSKRNRYINQGYHSYVEFIAVRIRDFQSRCQILLWHFSNEFFFLISYMLFLKVGWILDAVFSLSTHIQTYNDPIMCNIIERKEIVSGSCNLELDKKWPPREQLQYQSYGEWEAVVRVNNWKNGKTTEPTLAPLLWLRPERRTALLRYFITKFILLFLSFPRKCNKSNWKTTHTHTHSFQFPFVRQHSPSPLPLHTDCTIIVV